MIFNYLNQSVAEKIIGKISIVAGDYVDLTVSQIATVNGLDLVLEAAAAATSLFVGCISQGTGTYTASGIILKIAVEYAK